MSGADVAAREQHRIVSAGLGDARRVLEVGCGSGRLAARLAAEGREVTAIDRRLPEPRPAGAVRWIEGDFVALGAPLGPFDAVAFTTSLHHIPALDRAVDLAAALLAPGGRLVLDELDLDAPDDACAAWYYDLQEVLIAAGVYAAEHLDGGAGLAPRARWLATHAHHGEPPLHRGDAMIAAVRARFAEVEVVRGPYLYRHLARHLEGPRAAAIAQAILGAEARRSPAVGLAVTARRPI